MLVNFNHSQKVQNCPKALSSNLGLWGFGATDLFPGKKSGNQNKPFSGPPSMLPYLIVLVSPSFELLRKRKEEFASTRVVVLPLPELSASPQLKRFSTCSRHFSLADPHNFVGPKLADYGQRSLSSLSSKQGHIHKYFIKKLLNTVVRICPTESIFGSFDLRIKSDRG